MPPGTTNYPASLDTLSTLVEVRDLATTTLTADITSLSTSLPVASTTPFGATGVVTIEGEHIIYTSKTGTSFDTLTRGAFQTLGGTIAAPHASGTQVRILVIAATHRVQNDVLIALETKLGSGAGAPVAGQFLKGTGAGTSGWSALTDVDVTGALGFSPASLAGAAFAGAISIADGAGSVANAGSIRLQRSGTIRARNEGNTANVTLLGLNASDVMELRGGLATLDSSGVLTATTVAGTTVAATGSVTAAQAVLGSLPAQSGILRIPNAAVIRARNAGNTADVDMISVDATGRVSLGAAWGLVTSTGFYLSGTQQLVAGTLLASGTDPQLRWYDSNAAANEKYTVFGVVGGGFGLVAYDDVFATASTYLALTRSGGTASGIVLGVPISGTMKGHLFGTASGNSTALAASDANIKLYDFGGGSWAGIGADGSGNMWFRTGLSGTPDARMVITTGGTVQLRGDGLIDFPDQTGRKIDLYGTTWAIGIESSELRYAADTGGRHSFRVGGYSGTEYASIDAAKGVIGGGQDLLDRGTISATNVVNLPSNIFTSKYKDYLLKIWVDSTTSAGTNIGLWLRTGGTTESAANTYAYAGNTQGHTAGTAALGSGAGSTYYPLIFGNASGAIEDGGAVCWVQDPLASGSRTGFMSISGTHRIGFDYASVFMTGRKNANGANDSVTIVCTSGTMTGRYELYGLAGG